MRASRQRDHRGGSLQRNSSVRGSGPAIQDRLSPQNRPARRPVQIWKPRHRPSGGPQSVQDAKRYSPPQRVLRRAVVPPRTIFNAHNDIEPYRFRKHFLKIFQYWLLKKLGRRAINVPKGLIQVQRTLGARAASLAQSGRSHELCEPAKRSGSQRISSAHISSYGIACRGVHMGIASAVSTGSPIQSKETKTLQ